MTRCLTSCLVAIPHRPLRSLALRCDRIFSVLLFFFLTFLPVSLTPPPFPVHRLRQTSVCCTALRAASPYARPLRRAVDMPPKRIRVYQPLECDVCHSTIKGGQGNLKKHEDFGEGQMNFNRMRKEEQLEQAMSAEDL